MTPANSAPRPSRLPRIAAGVVLAGLALLVVAGAAAAGAVPASCASVTLDAGLGNTRTWYVGTGDVSGVFVCSTSSDDLAEVDSGAGVLLVCRETTTGATPPEQAQVMTVRAYSDSDAFGSPSTAGLWTWQSPNCAAGASTTFYCTSDGTSSGAPRYGLVRLVFRAQRTSLPTYDVNSDSTGNYGVIRCRPALSTLGDSTPAGSIAPGPYQGGDTLRSTVAADAAPYSSASATARLDVACGASLQVVGSFVLTTSTSTLDKLISGDLATWPDDCTLQQKVVLTRKSAISGLSSLDYAAWDPSSGPAGVTYTGATAARSALQLDRTLAASLNTWENVCSGTQSAVFTISVDLACVNVGPVTLPRGGTPATLTVTASYQEPDTGTSLPSDTASGVAGGVGPSWRKAPTPPESASWVFSATFTDGHGNTGTASRSVTFLSPATPGDPLSVFAVDVLAGGVANVTVHAEWDNGTAREGGASNITLRVQGPDGAWFDCPLTERGWGYYFCTFTAARSGRYELEARTRTDRNEPRSSPPAALRALAGDESLAAHDATTRQLLHDARASAEVHDANQTRFSVHGEGGREALQDEHEAAALEGRIFGAAALVALVAALTLRRGPAARVRAADREARARSPSSPPVTRR